MLYSRKKLKQENSEKIHKKHSTLYSRRPTQVSPDMHKNLPKRNSRGNGKKHVHHR